MTLNFCKILFLLVRQSVAEAPADVHLLKKFNCTKGAVEILGGYHNNCNWSAWAACVFSCICFRCWWRLLTVENNMEQLPNNWVTVSFPVMGDKFTLCGATKRLSCESWLCLRDKVPSQCPNLCFLYCKQVLTVSLYQIKSPLKIKIK